MQDDGKELEPIPKKRDLFEFLPSLEPLSEEDSMPEIDDPPPEPVTCFDDWVDEGD
jgi:antitoxin VapB